MLQLFLYDLLFFPDFCLPLLHHLPPSHANHHLPHRAYLFCTSCLRIKLTPNFFGVSQCTTTHTHTHKLTYTYICSKLIPTQLWLLFLFLQLLLPLLLLLELLLLQLLLLVVCHVCDSFHSSIFEAFFFRKKYQKIINAFVCVRWCVFVQFVSFAQLLASPTCAALLCSACNKSFAFVHIGNLLA